MEKNWIKEEWEKHKSGDDKKEDLVKTKNSNEKKTLSTKEIDIELLKTKNMNDDDKEIFLEELSKKSNKRIKRLKEQLSKLMPSSKDILMQQSNEEEVEEYKEGEINWLDNEYYDNWKDKIKPHTQKILGHLEEYELDDKIEPFKKIFLAHSKDKIIGKPQLAINTQVPFPLILERVTKITNEMKQEVNQFKYVFFDERVDGREKGSQRDIFSLNFRIYRVIDAQDKEYFIFSQEKLPNCSCEFNGMIVEMEHMSELKKSFGIKQLSRIFILKDFNPSVKILSKEALIQFTKTRKIGEKEWRDFIDLHPNGNFNRFVPEKNALRDAQILSGKRDGSGLHRFEMGPPGTGKSMGELETLDWKFNEFTNILEGGNSRMKMLEPSFKEKPANLGYCAKSERMGYVDEVGKMVEAETNKHQTQIQNILGNLNPMYDNKERLIGSGNDNECRVQATAKFIMVTNPVSGKPTIIDHVGLIDPTFLSRNIVWIQDADEQEFVFSGKSLERNPPNTYRSIYIQNLENKELIEKKKNEDINIVDSVGGISSREEFLTLFDTCYSFTCNIDEDKVEKLHKEITMLAREPMKSHVWKPRGSHHIYLLVDGLCKHRCLFIDYDPTFTPKEQDYELTERILVRMVKSWDTNMSPKKEWSGF
jgi:hypothetical protein